MEFIYFKTEKRSQLINITSELQKIVTKNSWHKGALLIFCPHTTASITINESADPDVQSDICKFMDKLVPQSFDFKHFEENSDAHLKTSMFGAHCLLIVENNKIMKGTWQAVYLCEWDGPRERSVWVQFLN